MAPTDNLDKLLRFDPLDTAEKITGKRWSDKDGGGITAGVGMLLAQAHGEAKDAALKAVDDSRMGNSAEDYLRILSDLGFEEVYREPFTSKKWKLNDVLHILAARDGFLLRFDTFDGDVNAASVYYNVEYPCLKAAGQAISSGSIVDMDGRWIVCGDHDAREAIRHKMARLRAGKPLTPWVKTPFLWLLHYADTDGAFDCDALNARRLAVCPDWARAMVGTSLKSAA